MIMLQNSVLLDIVCVCLQKNQYNSESVFNQSHARQLLFQLANYLNLEYAKAI